MNDRNHDGPDDESQLSRARFSWDGNQLVLNSAALALIGAAIFWAAIQLGYAPSYAPTNPGGTGAILRFEAMSDSVDDLVKARATDAENGKQQAALLRQNGEILKELATTQRILVGVAQEQASTSSRMEKVLNDHRVESIRNR